MKISEDSLPIAPDDYVYDPEIDPETGRPASNVIDILDEVLPGEPSLPGQVPLNVDR